MKPVRPFLSVVVCTKNRAKLLDLCLASLISQKSSRHPFEIIVVDNHSTDGTKNIVRSLIKKYPAIKYLEYRGHSVSAARNKGWNAARGTFVAFIDDDAVAHKNWIKSIFNFAARHHSIGIFGGPYASDTDGRAHSWLPKQYVELFNGTKEKELPIGREWLSGTNLIVRKDVLAKLRGFDEKLMFADGSFVFGEETKLLSVARTYGERVYYVPRIRVVHHTDLRKYSLRWQLQKYFRMGRSSVYVHNQKDTIWYHMASFADKVVRCMYWTVYPKSMPWKRRIFLALHGLFSWAGAFAVWIGIVPGCVGRSYEKNFGSQ